MYYIYIYYIAPLVVHLYAFLTKLSWEGVSLVFVSSPSPPPPSSIFCFCFFFFFCRFSSSSFKDGRNRIINNFLRTAVVCMYVPAR